MIHKEIMQRVNIPNFTSSPTSEILNKVTSLQALRAQSLAESRIKKGRQTKSVKKNMVKRGKTPKDPAADLLKLLKKMPPKERAAFLKQMKGE